jgi:hypothetical protein
MLLTQDFLACLFAVEVDPGIQAEVDTDCGFESVRKSVWIVAELPPKISCSA